MRDASWRLRQRVRLGQRSSTEAVRCVLLLAEDRSDGNMDTFFDLLGGVHGILRSLPGARDLAIYLGSATRTYQRIRCLDDGPVLRLPLQTGGAAALGRVAGVALARHAAARPEGVTRLLLRQFARWTLGRRRLGLSLPVMERHWQGLRRAWKSLERRTRRRGGRSAGP